MLNIINTPKELNNFIASVGQVEPAKIPSLLEKYKVVISPVIARLIQEKAA